MGKIDEAMAELDLAIANGADCDQLIYEKAYLLQSPLNLGTSEVISTYVFKFGLGSFRNFSYGTAVSLFNTIINWCLMFITNLISRKSTDGEVALF